MVLETMTSHKIGAGLVAVDAAGRVLAPFNTLGMYARLDRRRRRGDASRRTRTSHAVGAA